MKLFLTMDAKKIRASLTAGFCGYLLLSASLCFPHSPKMELELGELKFVLPQFTGPYREREANISPEEYEMAEQLKLLLEENDKQKVIEVLEGYYDIELSPAMLTLKAQVYFSMEMLEEAEETFLEVLSRKPQLIRVHADLGQLYLYREQNEQARQHFAKAVAYGSNEAIVHGQLAYLNLQLKGPYTAISEYQQAIALEPDNWQWHQGLLSALSQAGMYESAAALVTELLGKRPHNASLWLTKAALSLRSEQKMEALSSLEIAILLGEKNQNNLRTAAQLHLQLGSYNRAIELLNESLDTAMLSMQSINEYLVWLLELGLWNEADQLLLKTEARLSEFSLDDQSNFYWHRAKIDSKLNKSAGADIHFSKALELSPNNGFALLDYAEFKLKQGSFVNAELLYIRAEAIDETHKDAILGRAQLYLNTKDYTSALVQLRNAYVRYPELATLKENIEIVENIITAAQIERN
ncbi:Tetratricopeptide repeat-containing protein [Alteromonadaceae bacterium Bs31]|nr:Tetratricopeptide repeat-containing protein [Alteromonadaceae bacterium Bs31]